MDAADGIEVRLVGYGSAVYLQELELRDTILRRPLGMSIRQDDLSQEMDHYHVGCFVGGQLIGVLVLTPQGDGSIKMRQVAVDQAFQRQGAGTAMVEFAEQLASSKGYRNMVLNARREAVPFYLRLGYEINGDEFIEVGIPHRRMTKRIE
ncbi:MAG: GNAT family N-acetyltransferase [Saccharofermentanales bacterium]